MQNRVSSRLLGKILEMSWPCFELLRGDDNISGLPSSLWQSIWPKWEPYSYFYSGGQYLIFLFSCQNITNYRHYSVLNLVSKGVPTDNKSKALLGVQPEIFQGREGFMELGDFNKHFVKKCTKRKHPFKKGLEFFF